MRAIAAVAFAGALGALARWGLGSWFGQRYPGFPWGTLFINVSGSFVLGVLFALLVERAGASPTVRIALTTSLMGAYTTFSTFSLETYRLVEDGAMGQAALNVVGNLVLGLVAVSLGVILGRAIWA
jgi:CrcB protein